MAVDPWMWTEVIAVAVLVPLFFGAVAYRAASGAGIAERSRMIAAGAVGGGFAAWLVLVIVLGGAQVFRADPEGMFQPIVLGVGLPIVVGSLLLSRWPVARRFLETIPQGWLLAAQTPRILGVTFLTLMAHDKLPAQFALPAGIGDIAIGLAAPLVALAYSARWAGARGLAIGFNIVGLVDLVVAVGTAFLSAPGPLRVFMSSPSTELMTVLPLVLIPTFLLPTFVLTHIVSLRKLLKERSGARDISIPLSATA